MNEFNSIVDYNCDNTNENDYLPAPEPPVVSIQRASSELVTPPRSWELRPTEQDHHGN